MVDGRQRGRSWMWSWIEGEMEIMRGSRTKQRNKQTRPHRTSTPAVISHHQALSQPFLYRNLDYPFLSYYNLFTPKFRHIPRNVTPQFRPSLTLPPPPRNPLHESCTTTSLRLYKYTNRSGVWNYPDASMLPDLCSDHEYEGR